MGFSKNACIKRHCQGDCHCPFKSPSAFDTVTVTALATEAAECSAEQFVHLHMPFPPVAFSTQHGEGTLFL
jgi:hypothetical protein